MGWKNRGDRQVRFRAYLLNEERIRTVWATAWSEGRPPGMLTGFLFFIDSPYLIV